jgi:hypothetical protein
VIVAGVDVNQGESVGAGQIGDSNLQQKVDIGSGPPVTAAPAPTGGIIINGIKIGQNSAITLVDGRVASVDSTGNLIAGGKTWASSDLFGQGQGNSRSSRIQGSMPSKGGSGNNSNQAEGESTNIPEKGNGGRKKNEAVSIMGMWWTGLPAVFTIMIMIL